MAEPSSARSTANANQGTGRSQNESKPRKMSSTSAASGADGKGDGATANKGKEKASAAAENSTEMSNAAKKAQKKAEKAAKRASQKADRDPAVTTQSNAVTNGDQATNQGPSHRRSLSQQQAQQKASGGPKPTTTTLPTRESGSSQAQASGPSSSIQRRLSQSIGPKGATVTQTPSANRRVPFVAHLYDNAPRQYGLSHRAIREIHPAIQKVTLQIANYTICGSNARCVALLLALKAVIKDYSTPPSYSLPRHLPTTHLSPLLLHLKSHGRPLSISQANSIRWLKTYISQLDPSMTEEAAKTELCSAIDNYIREHFTIADEVIASSVAEKYIRHRGDTILVFGNSAVVRRALVAAIHAGKRFNVIVVDSRPLHEGKALVRSLQPFARRGPKQSWKAQGEDVQADDSNIDEPVEPPITSLSYAHISALGSVASRATLCLLGAHGVLADGSVVSRAGTAIVAMMAKEETQRRARVVVCAEGVKFTERVVANGAIDINELAPEHEFVPELPGLGSTLASSPESAGKDDKAKANAAVSSVQPHVKTAGQLSQDAVLNKWSADPQLMLLNPLHDVTPREFIDTIVTEYGAIPASAASGVVWRIASGGSVDGLDGGGMFAE